MMGPEQTPMEPDQLTEAVGPSRITPDDQGPGMAQYAYRELRRMVRAGRFRPEALLSEQQLAEEIGVGRTPIREAVSRLDQEGLLERLPKRGVRLRTLAIEEIHDLYELREWLEVSCVRRAMSDLSDAQIADMRANLNRASEAVEAGCNWLDYREHDRRFHASLWEASGNKRAIEVLGSLHDAVILDPTYQQGPEMPLQGRISIREHTAILDAIAARDSETAERRVVDHARAYRAALAERIFPKGRVWNAPDSN
jgi:DNA-binding GntR family transcriptional regulator